MKKMLVVFIALILAITACKNEELSNNSETSTALESTVPTAEKQEINEEEGEFASAFSWLDYEYDIVGKPKRQYPVGACALFATLSIYESSIALETGELLDLSEQHYIDCAKSWDDVEGVAPSKVLYFLETNGVLTEEEVPYTGVKKQTLELEGDYKLASWGEAMLEGYSAEKRVETIKSHLTKYGPIMTNLGVYRDFGDYTGGVYECDESSGEVSGHWITILGWVDDESIKSGGYWICKNSWGTDWGEDGFCKMAYDDPSGIDDYIIYFIDDPIKTESTETLDMETSKVPEFYSLMDENVILLPQDQGTYKTDALFAVIGLLESSLAIKTGNLVNLSEQYVINNFEGWSNDREIFPQGVWPEMILDFLVDSGTIADEDMAYTGLVDEKFIEIDPDYSVVEWDKVYLENYTPEQRIMEVKKSILKYGPVTTNIILYDDFKEYSEGIYQGNAANTFMSIHHITIIGWNDDDSIKNGGYWICKNSFGTDWGEGGFCKIIYNDSCGIDNYELYYISEAELNP